MASGDSHLPRSLTDADFQAFSLEVAQARADAQGHFPVDDAPPFPTLGAVSNLADEDLLPLVPDHGWQVDDARIGPTDSSFTGNATTQQKAMAGDFVPIHCNLSLAELMEHALLRAEGVLSDRGALCVKTLPYGGTTAGSYYRVEPELSPVAALEQVKAQRAEPLTPGLQLAPMDEKAFWALYQRAMDYGEDKALYQCDGLVELGLPGQTTGIRVICELASQAIMARHWLFLAAAEDEDEHQPQPSSMIQAEPLTHWSVLKPSSSHLVNSEQALVDDADESRLTIISLNGLKGEPCVEPLLETEVFVVIHPTQRLALVCGSRHGGDLFGAIATLLAEIQHQSSVSGLLLPDAVYCPGASGQQSALFLGEVGSGKQTLASALGKPWQRGPVVLQTADSPAAAPPQLELRPLFAGSYGNISGLTAKDSLHQHLNFGAVLENVPLQETSSRPRFSDLASSVLFRGAWQANSLAALGSHDRRDGWSQSQAAPRKIFLLVADTAGVLPAIARLTPAQAVYYFALGYGAELPGWSRHQLHPTAHFKAMDRRQAVRDSLRWQAVLQVENETEIYLVNTGWLGANAFEARSLQQRIPISISQALVQSALAGELPLAVEALSETQTVSHTSHTCIDPVFGWTLPLGLQQLPGRWYQPWNVWGDAQQWRVAAIRLAQQFQVQMAGLVAAGLPEAIAQAGPRFPLEPGQPH